MPKVPDYDQLRKALMEGAVHPRNALDPSWMDKGGIYAIWGSEQLRKRLDPLNLSIHASVQLGGEVKLPMRSRLKESTKRKSSLGEDVFCFYVGKTAHLKKRMRIQRFQKIVVALDKVPLKTMLEVSFHPEESWINRFYGENYAIAMLRPILNPQPER